MSEVDPDWELAQALQAGNEMALNSLIERHQESLYRFIYRYVLNETDAKDLTQECFVRIYFKIHQYKPTARFITWVYCIAINLCRDWARSRARRPIFEGFDFWSNTEGKIRIPNFQRHPDIYLLKKELLEEVERWIHELPHDLKTALILTSIEDRSHTECAHILKVTPKTIETRVYRARKIIEKKFKSFLKEGE